MRLIPRSLKWRAVLLTLWALASLSGVVWYHFGQSISRFVDSALERYRQRSSNDPMVRALAREEITPDTTVEELLARQEPLLHWKHDRFESLAFGERGVIGGVDFVAVNGRLVYARVGFCSHAPTFFDLLSPTEWVEYYASRDRHRQSVHASWAAVIGVTGKTARFFYVPDDASPDDDQP